MLKKIRCGFKSIQIHVNGTWTFFPTGVFVLSSTLLLTRPIDIRGELLPQFSIFLSPDFLFLHVLEFTTMYHTSLRQDVFMKEEYHYLNVSKVGTFTVYDSLDCTFECLGNPSCLSFNLAAYKGAAGKFLCELLPSEKYSNPEEYKRNDSSHHFSVKVGLILCIKFKERYFSCLSLWWFLITCLKILSGKRKTRRSNSLKKVFYIEYQLRNRKRTGVKVTDDKTSELFSRISHFLPFFLLQQLNAKQNYINEKKAVDIQMFYYYFRLLACHHRARTEAPV